MTNDERRPVKRAGTSRRLVAGKWVSAAADVGQTTLFSELVTAIAEKAAKNDKPKRIRKL
jgi:hypothetical protein